MTVENSRAERGRFAPGNMVGFKPGVSGNPGGRPAGLREVTELARSYSVGAIEALADIAQNGKSEMARIAAACALLDRGYGRPTVTLQGETVVPFHRIEHVIVRPGENGGPPVVPGENGVPVVIEPLDRHR